MKKKADDIRKKVSDSLAVARASIETSKGKIAEVKKNADAVRKNTDLTEVGKTKQLQTINAGLNDFQVGPFRVIHRERLNLRSIRDNLQKQVLSLPPLDKNDAVGAALDVEARAFVRQMGNKINFAELPSSIVAAIVRAPAILSGVSELQQRTLRERLINEAVPETMKEIREASTVLDKAEQDLNFVEAQFASEIGVLDRVDFAGWRASAVEPVEIEHKEEILREQEKRRKEDPDLSVEKLMDHLRSEVSAEKLDKIRDDIAQIEAARHRGDIEFIKKSMT
ncbi:hypothetical protein [Bradyrhizobium sp. USDA 10063]